MNGGPVGYDFNVGCIDETIEPGVSPHETEQIPKSGVRKGSRRRSPPRRAPK